MKQYLAIAAQQNDSAFAARIIFAKSQPEAREIASQVEQHDWLWTDVQNRVVSTMAPKFELVSVRRTEAK
jgi:hypothetical protein